MAKRLKPPYFGKYCVVCPFCNSQETRWIFKDDLEFSCCTCGKKCKILIATVKKKHSLKHDLTRDYDVEIITRSGARELHFQDDNNHKNLVLRPGDTVIFQYSVEPRLVMAVYNSTRGQHLHLHKAVPSAMREKYNKQLLAKTSWYVQTYFEDPEFKKSADSIGWIPATI